MPACLCCLDNLENGGKKKLNQINSMPSLWVLSFLRKLGRSYLFYGVHHNSRVASLIKGSLESHPPFKRMRCQSSIFLNKEATLCMAPGGEPLLYHDGQKILGEFIHSLAKVLWHGTQRELGPFSFATWDYDPVWERDKWVQWLDSHWVESEGVLKCIQGSAGQMVRMDVGRKTGAMVIGLLHPTPINEHLLCASHSSG